MYIEKTTAAEREAIESALCPAVDSLERAGRMLLRIQEDYFYGNKTSRIEGGEFQDVKDILDAVADTIDDFVTTYYMTTGMDGGGYSKILASSVERFKWACRIRKALDTARERGASLSTIEAISALPNEAAAARLNELGVQV